MKWQDRINALKHTHHTLALSFTQTKSKERLKVNTRNCVCFDGARKKKQRNIVQTFLLFFSREEVEITPLNGKRTWKSSAHTHNIPRQTLLYQMNGNCSMRDCTKFMSQAIQTFEFKQYTIWIVFVEIFTKRPFYVTFFSLTLLQTLIMNNMHSHFFFFNIDLNFHARSMCAKCKGSIYPATVNHSIQSM